MNCEVVIFSVVDRFAQLFLYFYLSVFCCSLFNNENDEQRERESGRKSMKNKVQRAETEISHYQVRFKSNLATERMVLRVAVSQQSV